MGKGTIGIDFKVNLQYSCVVIGFGSDSSDGNVAHVTLFLVQCYDVRWIGLGIVKNLTIRFDLDSLGRN